MFVWWYSFVFTGRQGCRPLQEIFIFPVGAIHESPVFVHDNRSFSGDQWSPLQGFLLYSVGAIHESPAFVHDMRSFSAASKQTPLRFVANLLRKNCHRPTVCNKIWLYIFCTRYAFVFGRFVNRKCVVGATIGRPPLFTICLCFCEMPRMSSPTINFKLSRRGDSRIARFFLTRIAKQNLCMSF